MTRDDVHGDGWLGRAWFHTAAVGIGGLLGAILATVIGGAAQLTGWPVLATVLVIAAAWMTVASLVVIVAATTGMFVCSMRQARRREQQEDRVCDTPPRLRVCDTPRRPGSDR